MGDRTSLQMQAVTDDAELRAQIRDAFEEYSGSDVWQDDWAHDGPATGNAWFVGSAESACGSSDELAARLQVLIEETGKEFAYRVWEDPKYEWLGAVHIHLPGVEPDHHGDCDSNGSTVLNHSQIRALVAAAGGHDHLTASLLQASGADHHDAFEAL